MGNVHTLLKLSLPLKVVQSAAERHPGTEAVAAVHACTASERKNVLATPFVALALPIERVGLAPVGIPEI